MIEIKKHYELDSESKRKVDNFIEEEFGHIPIVKETEWAKPDWTIILYQNHEIVTFYNIIERKIFVDNNEMKISGINNVITPKRFRGNGYASRILKETESLIFEELESELGVLLCADNLIPFYERLNWYLINCPVYFDQSNGRKVWRANTMLLTKKGKINPKEVDLNGLPW